MFENIKVYTYIEMNEKSGNNNEKKIYNFWNKKINTGLTTNVNLEKILKFALKKLKDKNDALDDFDVYLLPSLNETYDKYLFRLNIDDKLNYEIKSDDYQKIVSDFISEKNIKKAKNVYVFINESNLCDNTSTSVSTIASLDNNDSYDEIKDIPIYANYKIDNKKRLFYKNYNVGKISNIYESDKVISMENLIEFCRNELLKKNEKITYKSMLNDAKIYLNNRDTRRLLIKDKSTGLLEFIYKNFNLKFNKIKSICIVLYIKGIDREKNSLSFKYYIDGVEEVIIVKKSYKNLSQLKRIISKQLPSKEEFIIADKDCVELKTIKKIENSNKKLYLYFTYINFKVKFTSNLFEFVKVKFNSDNNKIEKEILNRLNLKEKFFEISELESNSNINKYRNDLKKISDLCVKIFVKRDNGEIESMGYDYFFKMVNSGNYEAIIEKERYGVNGKHLEEIDLSKLKKYIEIVTPDTTL